MIRAYADLGVDRVIPQLGSQSPERLDQRLRELEELVSTAA